MMRSGEQGSPGGGMPNPPVGGETSARLSLDDALISLYLAPAAADTTAQPASLSPDDTPGSFVASGLEELARHDIDGITELRLLPPEYVDPLNELSTAFLERRQERLQAVQGAQVLTLRSSRPPTVENLTDVLVYVRRVETPKSGPQLNVVVKSKEGPVGAQLLDFMRADSIENALRVQRYNLTHLFSSYGRVN